MNAATQAFRVSLCGLGVFSTYSGYANPQYNLVKDGILISVWGESILSNGMGEGWGELVFIAISTSLLLFMADTAMVPTFKPLSQYLKFGDS